MSGNTLQKGSEVFRNADRRAKHSLGCGLAGMGLVAFSFLGAKFLEIPGNPGLSLVLFIPLLAAAMALSLLGGIHALRVLTASPQDTPAVIRVRAQAGAGLSVTALLLALILLGTFASTISQARQAAHRAREYQRQQEEARELFPAK